MIKDIERGFYMGIGAIVAVCAVFTTVAVIPAILWVLYALLKGI